MNIWSRKQNHIILPCMRFLHVTRWGLREMSAWKMSKVLESIYWFKVRSIMNEMQLELTFFRKRFFVLFSFCFFMLSLYKTVFISTALLFTRVTIVTNVFLLFQKRHPVSESEFVFSINPAFVAVSVANYNGLVENNINFDCLDI